MLFQEMSQAAGGQLFPSSPPPSTATRPTTCEPGDDPHRAATPLTRSRADRRTPDCVSQTIVCETSTGCPNQTVPGRSARRSENPSRMKVTPSTIR